ncbi:MAG: hypothetical protein ACFFCD_09540 [Promethearchaeota archaeon]
MTKEFYYTLEDDKIKAYVKLTTEEKLKWLEEIDANTEMVLNEKEKQFRNKLRSAEI